MWLTADSWCPIYHAVESRRNARKMRLFGCACCRRHWGLLTDPRSREAVEVAEQFADGVVGKDRLISARKAANEVVRKTNAHPQNWTASHFWMASTAEMVAHATYQDTLSTAAARACEAVQGRRVGTHSAEKRAQLVLLRDIFGNPFRPVAFNPAWRSDTAVSLARQMYESRDFSLMPILADALQDAGCEHPDVLAHCRDPDGTHVRGCWVVDLLLGKQ